MPTPSIMAMQLPHYLSLETIQQQALQTLHEDISNNDLTASLIPAKAHGQATIITREPMVLCGRPWVEACFTHLDTNVTINWQAQDSDNLEAGQVICQMDGNARALLTAERSALNYLQMLSAVASKTKQFVQAVSGLDCKILDTRKTLPGLRLAQKYAVLVGGGENQRVGLYDGILIKENHIASAGSIAKVLQQALALYATHNIQIEVENLDELEQALSAGAPNILLDNFSLADMCIAVKASQARALLEASGNIELNNVRDVASTGVDRISIGALTKHIEAKDLSMRWQLVHAYSCNRFMNLHKA